MQQWPEPEIAPIAKLPPLDDHATLGKDQADTDDHDGDHDTTTDDDADQAAPAPALKDPPPAAKDPPPAAKSTDDKSG